MLLADMQFDKVDMLQMIAVAFKTAIDYRRRALAELRERLRELLRNREQLTQEQAQILRDTMAELELEILTICREMQQTLSHHLIPFSANTESLIIYYHMQGDYLRYACEVGGDRLDEEEYEEDEDDEDYEDPKVRTIRRAEAAYSEGIRLAQQRLAASHVARLGIIRDYSLFVFETVGDMERGMQLVAQAIEAAERDASRMSREASQVLNALRDNYAVMVAKATTRLAQQQQQR